MSSSCDVSTCTEALSAILSKGFMTIKLTSHGTTQSLWQETDRRRAQRLIALANVLAARVSPR
jgi:hypothetical protein